ncbi:MAG: sodium:proton antiporter [Pseudomonadota bacterium]
MRLGRTAFLCVMTMLLAVTATPASAATALGTEPLPLFWAAPFVGMLLSVALMPLAAPDFWHRHFGKISAFWALGFLMPCIFVFDIATAASVTLHTMAAEFIPFLIILIALYTVAGGIFVEGQLRGGAIMNTAFLGLGSLLASLIGTTGASMVLIRPLIRANRARAHNVHVVIFFIFLVSNIGGALTPLGDPPLFLGYLKGVSFFWPTQHLLMPMLLCLGILLGVFFVLDSWFFSHEKEAPKIADTAIRVHGHINILLMIGILGVVLLTPQLQLGEKIFFDLHIRVSDLLRDILLLTLAAVSLWLTPKTARQGNNFNWHPVREVSFLFITIFLTAIPVLAMLQQGANGTLGALTTTVFNVDGTPHNAAFFWMTGVLSAFLDNAPTYLVFFQLAGGDAPTLMGPLNTTLVALSCGAVFMGALSYIGNAPNFMVRTIAADSGINMPSFFGFMGWSCLFLMPVFALITILFFM